MNNRRKLVIALGAGALTAPLAAEAQQAGQVSRIGYLSSGSPSNEKPRDDAFRQSLRQLGYFEGKNVVIEYRYADGKLTQLPDLAAELVRLRVDVVVTGGGPPSRAAKNATKSVPIVMINVSDPVALGFVSSLARPEENITGLSSLQNELGAKRLELLKEVVPTLSHVAVLVNRGVPGYGVQIKEVEVAARALGLQLQALEVRGSNDLGKAFSAITSGRAGGLIGLTNPTFNALQGPIAELAVKNRVPSVYGYTTFAEAGGLMAYGPSVTDLYRRAAIYVDKILKGAKPGDLPIEQPTKFELVVNLKTAKALGLTIPQPFLMRADRVIE
jgi:putative ABC transport system substrate-binding protein